MKKKPLNYIVNPPRTMYVNIMSVLAMLSPVRCDDDYMVNSGHSGSSLLFFASSFLQSLYALPFYFFYFAL